MNNTNNIDIVEEITYLEIVEDNTTIEIVDEIVNIVEIGIQGPQGKGIQGDKGNKGDKGEGFSEGGEEGDILAKNSDEDFDTIWIKNPKDEILNEIGQNFIPNTGGTITGDLEVTGNITNTPEKPKYNYIVHESNLNPSPNNDISEDFTPYMLWSNTETGKIYICLKNDNGNAIWQDFSFDDVKPDGVSGLMTGVDKIKLDRLNLPFIFFQDEVSDTWIIDHNLNKFPMVVITDSAFSIVECEITYLSANRLEVKFNTPFRGKATLQ